MLSRLPGKLDRSESEAALKIMRHITRQFIQRDGKQYKSQEVSNTVWSLATLGFGVTDTKPSNTGNEYTFLDSDDPLGDKQLMEETMAVAIRHIKENCRRYKSQEMNNFAWTMARLGQRDDDLLKIMGNELINPKRRVTSQDIGTTLWSFATMEYYDADFYRSFVRRVDRNKARYTKPQELSNGKNGRRYTAELVPT